MTSGSLIDGVAIVGMAGRWPGAATLDDFWANLLAGRESITRFAPGELSPLIPDALRNHPRYVPAHGVLADADRFDAAFFGIPAREAVLMDPQQRVFLELCWNALEHAGVDSQQFPGSIGVYAGTSNNGYRKLVDSRPELVRAAGEFATMLANEKDYVATRVAHRLGLNGPALSIQTACSTSLVAVAQAWYALMSWQCDLALAGGINVVVPQESGYLPVEGGMESEDGHCRPFDAAAGGTVFSSGGAVVALKRAADAVADGDTIWALIRGVAVNNDGGDKASFTAPSVRGQAAVIRQALATADVSADSIGYVEAHGTGTQLGDPIEVEALTRAYLEDGGAHQYCWLGSVKGNIGHLVAASGVTGLIKTVLALHHGRIPPTVHFKAPNPEIDFAASPFKVADRVIEWPRSDVPRRAGVSSFGVGGTNAHLVLEEAPTAATEPDKGRPYTLLPLSAHDEDALRRRAAELAQALPSHGDADLPDIGYTLAIGRRPLSTRTAVVAGSIADAVARLSSVTAHRAADAPRVVYMFPGQGSQHVGMARELVDSEPVFREHFEICCELASTHLERDLRALILPSSRDAEMADALLAETRYTQPALFAVEYALAKMWEGWGVVPDAMIGHSIGEYVAAALAGVFELEDVIALVCARGAAMYTQPSGTMLAVRVGAEILGPQLPSGVEIAALNAPSLTVVGGEVRAIEAFASTLSQSGVASSRLKVSHAFHSALMDGAIPAFRSAFDGVRMHAPQRMFYSCVSGAPITSEAATSPEYWCRQLRQPVRFAEALRDASMQGHALYLEVGPGRVLTGLARSMLGELGQAIATLGAASEPGNAAEHAQRAVGECWCAGAAIGWSGYFTGHRRRRVPLPGYPFRGVRYWIDIEGAAPAAQQNPNNEGSRGAMSAGTISPDSKNAARQARLADGLRGLFENLCGERIGPDRDQASFLELGLDSLALTQATLEIERRFNVKLKFRRLMEDLDSIDKLAAMLDAALPPEAVPPPAPSPQPAIATDASSNPALAQLIQSQMTLMQQQTQLLAALAGGQAAPTVATQGTVPPPVPTVALANDAVPANLVERPFGASARIHVRRDAGLTPAQQAFLDVFTRRYNARTAKSKAFSQQHRTLMADPRVVTGFHPLWKDLVYPIVVERSQGSRLWDIDGNEYIDLLNGFGVNFLGHQPPYITQALQKQIDTGFEIGPQHPLTAEVSALISDMTGMPRVAFCNTGSEAVMGAMRIARTVTGRKTIVVFKDSYHGIFDEVIVRGGRGLQSFPAAPGILPEAVDNVLVLDYGSDDALRVINERASGLAAVMIEPVQGRNPGLQPRAFVRQLRALCDAGGCALIFDEVITGFRVAPGGAQEFYGVRADIATYGKIIGGGLPLAAIAGNTRWMDALDGGVWRYGDDSYPEAGVTYFAGTFVRHPLALAAAKASLQHVRQRGPALQRELNDRTARLVEHLNAVFAARHAPMRALAFSSLWRVNIDADQPCASLFYYALRERGLHLYEQFNCFLSEAHGDAEVDMIVERIESAVGELIQAGVLASRHEEGKLAGATSEPVAASVHSSDAAQSPAAGLPETVPLTDGQTEKWLSCQYGGLAELTCNESTLLMLEGDLDRAALERALALVFGRHEAFSLSFAPDGATQSVRATAPPAVEFVDLGDDARNRLEAFCARELRRPFNLGRAPLARARLLRLAPHRHALLIVAHHLVFDGWSEAVVLDELALAYNALAAGREPDLPPTGSYRAYVLAERVRRAQPAAMRQLEYWKRLYATIPRPLNLPGDRSPTPEPDFAAATLRHEFPEAWVEALRTGARRERVTLYSLLLSGVGALLWQLCGQDDFAVAVPFAGQALAGSGHLVGDGVDTLPLRMNVDGAQSFTELAHAVHHDMLDAAENQDLTLFTLLRALRIGGGEGRGMGQVIVNLNPRALPAAFDGLRHASHDCAKVALFQDLFFNFTEVGAGLTLDLHYHTALFDVATVRRWIAHYETLLAGAVVDGKRMLNELPRPNERGAQASDGTGADARVDNSNSTFPARFAAQVAATPQRIAIECDGLELTYAELARRASAVARVLVRQGVQRGDLVGICVPRSPDMLVAALGIMQSGAAYVPLDPGFPAERLQYMAGHSDLKHVVVTDMGSAPEAVTIGREVIELAGLDEAVMPDVRLPDLRGDDVAYVLYTSGSTGKPKGVCILHRNLDSFLSSMIEMPGIVPDDVMCAVTTLSFDIAGLELYLPLIVGARIVLASDEEVRDPDRLIRLMRMRGVTLLQTTPSTLRLLLAGRRIEGLDGMKLLVGGEAMPRDVAEAVLPHCRELWNMYGPTETTIWSTLHRVHSDQGPVPIGKPIANTRIHVLDALHQEVPTGSIGEIWIAGDGVAKGYLHDPELTAARFLPDTFAKDGSRMYRTGDLGSLRDGVLHFHGRVDDQIKIRGFRIEPGDIEAAAMADADLRAAVAVAYLFGEGDSRLVLYVEADKRPGLVERLRARLRELLPGYMMPGYIEVLEALPRTPNGKLDRKGLPPPSGTAPEPVAAAAAKQEVGALERAFMDIWRDILRVDAVGLNDNFFDLGGDSLLAVRVFQRAQEITGVNLPLAILLTAPTVSGQAAAFRDAGAREPKTVSVPKISAPAERGPWSPLVPIQPEGSRPPLFCVHAVGGNVLNYVPLARALGTDQPFYGLQAVGLDGRTPALESLPSMASLYLAEIRGIQPEGPYYLAGGSMGGMIAWEMACQLRDAGEQVAMLALFDTFGPGNRLFEIARAGSLERMGYRWNDRLKRLRSMEPGGRGKAMWNAVRWRGERTIDLMRSRWLHMRGKVLPHAMRYRLIERSHERAYFGYDPRPYDGAVFLFRAAAHPEVMNASRALGWEKVASGTIEVIDLPGSHDDLIEQPALVDGLREVLERVQAGTARDPVTLHAVG